MPAFRFALTLALAFVALAPLPPCDAQEPTDRETIEQLRQEVIELRKAVKDLTRQLAEMEYQQLPRATEAPKEQAAEPPKTVFEFSKPLNWLDYPRDSKIIDMREQRSQRSRLKDTEAPPLPKNLRFPVNIERGTGTQTPPKRVLDLWAP